MIIINIFDLFVYLFKSLDYNDFTLTFFYIAFVICVFKLLRGLIYGW